MDRRAFKNMDCPPTKPPQTDRDAGQETMREKVGGSLTPRTSGIGSKIKFQERNVQRSGDRSTKQLWPPIK